MKKTKQLHKKRSPEDSIPDASAAADFLEDYRHLLSGKDGPSKLISLRVPENLLRVFRAEADRNGQKYQSQIIRLMRDSLKRSS